MTYALTLRACDCELVKGSRADTRTWALGEKHLAIPLLAIRTPTRGVCHLMATHDVDQNTVSLVGAAINAAWVATTTQIIVAFSVPRLPIWFQWHFPFRAGASGYGGSRGRTESRHGGCVRKKAIWKTKKQTRRWKNMARSWLAVSRRTSPRLIRRSSGAPWHL